MPVHDDIPGVATAISHGDPIAPVIFGVTLILVAALVGRHLARRTQQPSVLGELLMGLLLGNGMAWSGYELLLVLREDTAVMEMTVAALGGLDWPATARLVLGEEVGLVFAWIGRGLGVMSTEVFSAIVSMVIVTTFATPPMRKALFTQDGGHPDMRDPLAH